MWLKNDQVHKIFKLNLLYTKNIIIIVWKGMKLQFVKKNGYCFKITEEMNKSSFAYLKH